MNSRKSFATKAVLRIKNKTLLKFCSVFFILGWLPTATPARADDNAPPVPVPVTAPAPIRFLLTFDDGPSGDRYNNSTEQVLDVLANNHVQPGIKALFFTQTRAVNGGSLPKGRAVMQREVQEGHLLALHTATPRHTNHRSLDDDTLNASLQTGIDDLTAITGQPPKLVRPPFWNYDQRTFGAYTRHGLHMLLTDLSANDGKIWGINWSFHKHSNMLSMLAELKPQWQAGTLPVVDGCTPVIVTFHDVNTYTSNHVEVYLEILVQVAKELDMPLTEKPFYDQREAIERAALARTVTDARSKQKLPGFWDWLWH